MPHFTGSHPRPGQFPGIVFSADSGDWGSITPAQLEMAKAGVDPFSAEAAVAPEETPADVMADAAEAPAEVITEPEVPAKKGNPDKALHALRSQNAQYEKILTDPDLLVKYAERAGFTVSKSQERRIEQQMDAGGDPLAAFDPESRAALQALFAPMQAKLDAQEHKIKGYDQMLTASEQRAELTELDAEFPGAGQAVTEFDNARPELAEHYGAFDKYAITLGSRITDPTQQPALVAELLQAMDPEARAALVAPYATEQATSMLADKIKPGAKTAPVTLGGAPPARGNDILPDMARISRDQYASLSPEVRQRMLNGG